MSIKQLPPMEHTFQVNVEGEETRHRYKGTFTYRRPPIGVRVEIRNLQARLGGDLKSLDDDSKFINKVLATLRFTVQAHDDAPWWEKNNFMMGSHDLNVAFDMYREIQKFEDKWFEQVWGSQEEKKPEEE